MQDSYISQGIKYISSRRGAEISGYTADYIGQLCRAGKLVCQMIGRTRFVSEESLLSHKETVAAENVNPERVANIYSGRQKKYNRASEVTVLASSIAAAHEKAVAPMKPVPLAEKISVSYASDERPLLPEVKGASVVSSVANVGFVSNAANTNSSDSHVASNVARKIAVSSKGVTSSAVKSLITKFSTSEHLLYPVTMHSMLRRRIMNAGILAILFTGMFVNYYFLANSTMQNVSGRTAGAAAADAFGEIVALARFEYGEIASIFDGGRALSVNMPTQGTDVPVLPQGMVVAPSTGSNASDQAEKQKLAATFSDQVSVNPDQSGTAGVITPVFKKGNGSNFMYVLVPVKGKQGAIAAGGAVPAAPEVSNNAANASVAASAASASAQ